MCFVGVPLDIGTCNRPGARFGPRQIRSESTPIRSINFSTGIVDLIHVCVHHSIY